MRGGGAADGQSGQFGVGVGTFVPAAKAPVNDGPGVTVTFAEDGPGSGSESVLNSNAAVAPGPKAVDGTTTDDVERARSRHAALQVTSGEPGTGLLKPTGTRFTGPWKMWIVCARAS